MKHSMYLLITLCGLSINVMAQKPSPGKLLYDSKCARCHGFDGTEGNYGAANLRQSGLNDAKLVKKISNGGWIMPAWKKTLTPDQILLIAAFVKTLRN
jgi:cytochrome c6